MGGGRVTLGDLAVFPFPPVKRHLGNAAFTMLGIQQDVKKAVAVRVFQELAKEVSVDLSVILMKD